MPSTMPRRVSDGGREAVEQQHVFGSTRNIAVKQAHGINHEVVVRLAKLHKPVGFFDTSKPSKDGYLVRVEMIKA